MMNCENSHRSFTIPSTVKSEGLELRVGPPALTAERLEKLQAEVSREGKIIFLDEMYAGI